MHYCTCNNSSALFSILEAAGKIYVKLAMEYYCVISYFIYILIFISTCNITVNSDSCTRTISPNNEFTSKILQQDQLIDIWGYKINWYNKEDGWTDLRRNLILKHNKKMINKIKEMPAFTKYGYKKMEIPVELHNFILQSMKHNSSGLVTEKCEHDDPFHNCQRVKDDGTLGNNIQ